MTQWRSDPIALSGICRERLPQLSRARFWIEQPAMRPIGEYLTRVGVSLDAVFFRHHE